MSEQRLFTVTLAAEIVLMAEDEGHAKDIVRDALEDVDRFARVKVVYNHPKQGGDK